MQLLHIDSAITGDQSVSRQLTARTVAAWVATHPGTQVQHLDLAADVVPHLGADALGFRTGQAAETAIQREENALSEALVSQFLASDVIVIGAGPGGYVAAIAVTTLGYALFQTANNTTVMADVPAGSVTPQSLCEPSELSSHANRVAPAAS